MSDRTDKRSEYQKAFLGKSTNDPALTAPSPKPPNERSTTSREPFNVPFALSPT